MTEYWAPPLESAGEAAAILRREAAEYADLSRRLEHLTSTRSEAPLLVVSLGEVQP
jgi:hypothetical protein